AEIIRAKHYIDQWEMNQMVQMDAFPIFDEKIIQFLVGQLSGDLAHYDQYIEIISTRRRFHWYPEYSHEYEAIFQAIQLMKHMEELDQFIPEQPSSQMFQAYVDDYYLIDTAYRKFYVAYDQIEEKERLHQLREKLENIYVNRFVEELAMKWVESKERDGDQQWPIAGIPQQKDFYRNWVQTYMKNDERLFVVISDALRYEVAKEVMDVLNSQ